MKARLRCIRQLNRDFTLLRKDQPVAFDLGRA